MKNLPPNATTWTSVGLIGLGLLTLFFAWNGAAGIPDTRAQFPYLISGGLGGVALVGAGLVLVRTFEGRKDTHLVVQELKRLRAVVERLEAAQQSPLVEDEAEAHVAGTPSSAPAPAGSGSSQPVFESPRA